MIYLVSCTAVCSYVKSWGGPFKFEGSGPPPDPLVVAPLQLAGNFNCIVETEGLSKVTDSQVHGKSSNMGALKM